MVPVNSLADTLDAQEPVLKAASAQLQQTNLARVEEKRERQEAGTPLPEDKSCL